ncbi:MAG: DUF4249 domain-containing protein [Rufibacter sp.]
MFCFLLLLASCEEPYSPEVVEKEHNFLVVTGFINANGPTNITLSRTQTLADEKAPKMETNAIVTVQEEGGESFPLPGNNKGAYTHVGIPINPEKRYRLLIMVGQKVYASDYVGVNISPPIDDVNWTAENEEVAITINTHDAQNKTRYYRWEYEETWEYTAFYFSEYEFINGQLQYRKPENDIYLCWRNAKSTNTLITSTVTLGEDVVSKFPIVTLPSTSDKILRKYSILVRQYAISKEAYQYYETLKKNTENIGSLFDPLPTQLTGNIKNINDAGEPVIGFITVSSVDEKRIFIKRDDLPGRWKPIHPEYCELDTIVILITILFFRNHVA